MEICMLMGMVTCGNELQINKLLYVHFAGRKPLINRIVLLLAFFSLFSSFRLYTLDFI